MGKREKCKVTPQGRRVIYEIPTQLPGEIKCKKQETRPAELVGGGVWMASCRARLSEAESISTELHCNKTIRSSHDVWSIGMIPCVGGGGGEGGSRGRGGV